MVFPPVKIDCYVFRLVAVLLGVLLQLSALCQLPCQFTTGITINRVIHPPSTLQSESENVEGIVVWDRID